MEMPEYKEVKELTNVGYEYKVDMYGAKRWYLNGKHHREGGPAIEYISGNKYWYQNGDVHREDGPAIEFADGAKRWYLSNIEVSEKDFNEVWECPLDRLPLYINTEFAPIMRRRLSTCN